MTTVKFYEEISDERIKFAVIIAKKDGKWIFCKHQDRNTYEIPGGHRELGETIEETAKRELYEETGAVDYTITPVCVYSVITEDNFNGEETFGKLYFAEVKFLERKLHNEIEKIILTDDLPKHLTYPEIQPKLLAEAQHRGIC